MATSSGADDSGSGPSLGALLDSLEAAVLALLQSAPAGSPAQLAGAAELAFAVAHAIAAGQGEREGESEREAVARRRSREERLGLVVAMERCLDLIGVGLVDAGVALPALAMAVHTARSSEPSAVASLAASRYEIETLLPVPGSTPSPRKSLDVPAQSLVRRPLPVTDEGGASRGAGRDALASAWPEAARREVARLRLRLR